MKSLLNLLLAFSFVSASAQTGTDSLLNDLEKETNKKTEKVTNIFKSPRIVMTHSAEMLPAGVLDFRILHRFGSIKTGIQDMFGLDNASMRMSFDYGITKDITVGLGRSTVGKDFDFFVKGRILQQRKGEKSFPFTVALVGGVTQITQKAFPKDIRTSLYLQMILGRKFGEQFSLQLTPTYLNRKLVFYIDDEESVVALGIGGRVKLSNRVHFLVDAVPALSGVSKQFVTPLSVGFDIETGGHVFQLHFSNAVGMNERQFITTTTQEWGRADVSFGFNLSRVFQIKKNTSTNW
jgi:hypothetical protein